MNLLETERLMIRELDVNDASLIYKYSIEKSMKEELPDQVYESLTEARKVIQFLSTNYKSMPQFYPLVYGIALKKTNTLIGHIGLSEQLDGVEIGYAIGMDYQETGYATEAVGAFSKWAKCSLKLNAIYGIVKADNKRSQKVLSKNHFIFHEEVFMKSFDGKNLNKIYIYE
ncbi:MAG: acetyltransferase family [Sphingobacterium sp.]|jgi:ribosomal-protein-alanine N-acetyltransferase|nr:acetyltransferase family [Sphingobacterium sp.]